MIANDCHYDNFHVQTDSRGVTTITLDVPNRPLNVLTQQAMAELSHIIGAIEQSHDVHVVLLRSGKESGFLAGADVNVIATIDDERARDLIEAGQDLFARIEALPMPTVVAIDGVCLGGGLELALACDYRIARNNSSTQIGLPEIKLGLIPGWGGTQRLPKLVGFSTALKMILTGELVDAHGAGQGGLVDRLLDPERWDAGIDEFVGEVAASVQGSGTGSSVPTQSHLKKPMWQRLLDSTGPGRWLILRKTRQRRASKVENYPALAAALRAITATCSSDGDGFLVERNEFVKLLRTPTCRSLLRLFFARERARQLATWTDDVTRSVHQPPIRKVAVIGAGAMGAGIGQLAGYRGFDVVMKEINEEALQAGRERIEKLVQDIAKRKRFDDVQRTELMNRFAFTCHDESLADVDLVIEAVVEREDVKSKVFASLDKTVKESAILASNTSSLSVSRMAEATRRPNLVAGLHFFNPVHRMELVEVVRTEKTDDACIARLVTFVRALGKTPVVTSDSSGFLVNRVLFPYLGEAVLMVREGFDVEQIDREIRRFGMPMGPLELLDHVGIDVAHHVAGSLEKILPGVGPVVAFLRDMVQNDRLGRKSDQGFYHYQKGVKQKPVSRLLNPVSSPANAIGFADDGLTSIQRRLVYPMLAEAIRCFDEGVVNQPWAIDLAMVLGTGFAPHRGGPLRLVETITPPVTLSNMKRLQSQLGSRFQPPRHLVEMVEQREDVFPEVDRRVGSLLSGVKR